MKIWKNTSTLNNYDKGLSFTKDKKEAIIALLGSKPIMLQDFPNLKGIFRAGIGKDNVPEKDAFKKGILVRYPSQDIINIIFDETATYTCSLIFKMLYNDIATLETWEKKDRNQFKEKVLLVVGNGNIGKRVTQFMRPFLTVNTYDILENNENDLIKYIQSADCITIHIPKTNNEIFFNLERINMMKDNAILINTSRGSIVDEDALYSVVKLNKIRAAFDVFWEEPYNGKLKEFYPDKFYMSPHIASTCSGFLEGCREGLNKLINDIKYV